ncbi:uncharacterized protein LOC105184172 [Harpegnathos saltator]|uniref:Uncharacterized protein n=1 Tax=Harpegnathos saltator TaxID=610380 RepID=E2BLF4_HARSA|nr:uncharacterized protein LOC105184172 [Harpegnathos saltator]XP_025162899.1 uncharacterized protein LOC105184172 [Harpegnathos saltator]EFN83506.1 hypothetical protein EAI_15441 [Harpegnathos saltator]
MLLIPLLLIIGPAVAFPLADMLDSSRPDVPQEQKALFVSTEITGTEAPTEHEDPREPREMVEDATKKTLSETLKSTSDHPEASADSEAGERKMTQGRKHKAMFVDYPLVSPIYPGLSAYEIDGYEEEPAVTGTERSSGDSAKRYQESNIFYIRLPPTPYMFVPGLGYISQPPTYSVASAAASSLRPQVVPVVGQLPQLLQLPAPHAKPVRPGQPGVYPAGETVNPFIKLPIDFVSNGKPTAVYQWQKKPGKKPADSPITNLDSLSADFVSNGKPTSIYQWQANLKRPDASLNSLDLGPYNFNGKPTGLYLLGPDGSSAMHQSIRRPDYQADYRSAYY